MRIFLSRISLLLILWAGISFYSSGQGVSSGKAGKPCTETTCKYQCSGGWDSSSKLDQGLARNGVLLVVIILVTAYLYYTFKKWIYLISGSLITVCIVGSFLYSSVLKPNTPSAQVCSLQAGSKVIAAKKGGTAKADEFLPATNEFESADSSFKSADSSFSATGAKPDTSEFKASTEFQGTNQAGPEKPSPLDYRLLYQLCALFLLVAIIGIAIKYPAFQRFRGVSLLGSVVYLGFYSGACPCMIMSFQNTILAILGSSTTWISMLWFLGLLPLTYFLGKVWCGWLCHLGGLQEFLFQSSKLNILKSVVAQKVLKYIQISFLVLLIGQLIITRSNIYVHYDPFKVAYNLTSANTTGYVLLGLLLVTSVLIYRPFCRAVCPVGLILGWITYIPKARKLSKADTCVNCLSCSNACKQHALIHRNKTTELRHEDCIMCGECLSSCKKSSLSVSKS